MDRESPGRSHGLGKQTPGEGSNCPNEQNRVRDAFDEYPGEHIGEHDDPLLIEDGQRVEKMIEAESAGRGQDRSETGKQTPRPIRLSTPEVQVATRLPLATKPGSHPNEQLEPEETDGKQLPVVFG